MITLLFLAFVSQAHAERLNIPFGTSIMDCGKPDPRETPKDGPVTCVNSYKKTIPNAKFTIKNGKIEGKVYGYTEDGDPKYEGMFHNGLPDGEVKEYYSKEKKRFNRISHYRAGQQDGVVVETNDYNDGQTVTQYKDDKRYGPRYVFQGEKIKAIDDCDIDNTGFPIEKCDGITIPGYDAKLAEYKAGKADEKAAKDKADNSEVVRKNKAGIVIERYTLKGGRRYGKHEINFPDGKPQFISDEEGSIRKSETEYFEGGQLKRKSTYDPKHGGYSARELAHEEYYQNGKLKLTWERKEAGPRESAISFKDYYDNGKLQTEGMRKGSVFGEGRDPMNLAEDGVIKDYFENGQLGSTQTFKDGKRDGLTRTIYLDENKKPLISESTYSAGVLQKTVTIDQKTKKTMRVQEFMPDGSTKSDKSF